MRKWWYLSHWASNQKNKGTLLSWTLKVEESKVPLFFWVEAPKLRYGHFLIFTRDCSRMMFWKEENGHISAPEPQITKIKVLCFLELQKLKKAKYLYFFDLRLLGWYMAIFWYLLEIAREWCSEKKKMAIYQHLSLKSQK